MEDNSDLVVGATLQNHGGVVVENKGILKIGDDTDGIVYTNSPRILGQTYAIDNTATGTEIIGEDTYITKTLGI